MKSMMAKTEGFGQKGYRDTKSSANWRWLPTYDERRA